MKPGTNSGTEPNIPATRKEAKKQETAIKSVADDPGKVDVHVRTQDELNKNRGAVDKEQVKAVSNEGLKGKTYKDERIVPSDTNAPDAGVTPDGVRIAK